jgi:tetratricopeptide (TPR) repeat protein
MLHSIHRTLPRADVLLCDTGSTDGTWAAALSAAADDAERRHWLLPLATTPWVNFQVSRNACLQKARVYGNGIYRWLLLMDADQTLAWTPHREGDGVSHDVNYLTILPAAMQNTAPLLLSFDVAVPRCAYRLVTHEYLHCDGEIRRGYYHGFHLVHHADGSNRRTKFERDASLLLDWLIETPASHEDVARAYFYLAQSYEGLGNVSQARDAYETHLRYETFTNYRYMSRYRIAALSMRLNASAADVERLFLESLDEHDGIFRWEPYYYLAFMAEKRGQLHRCVMWTSAALGAPPVDYGRMPLFLEGNVYDSELEEQRAFCLLRLGRRDEARRIYERLLSGDRRLQPDQRARIQGNLRL